MRLCTPDRGYDSFLTTQRCHSLGLTDIVCAKKKRKGEAKIKKPLTSDCAGPLNAPAPGSQTLVSCAAPPTGLPGQRLGQVALAVALILTVSSSNGQAMDRLDRPIRARSQ